MAKKKLPREGQALLQGVLDAPEEDAPRLVCADWLEEHGQPERAEFIRVQIALARLADDEPERLPLERRERALLAAHKEAWCAGLPARASGRQLWFRRGFVAGLVVTAGELSHEAPSL